MFPKSNLHIPLSIQVTPKSVNLNHTVAADISRLVFSAVAVYEINSSPLKGSHIKCVVLPHCLCLILGKVKSPAVGKDLIFWKPKNYLPNTFRFE